MKGILFNEKFGLESATLNGSKTRTSRDELKDAVEIMGWLRQGLKIGEHPNTILYVDKDGNRPLHKCKYKVGEIVAIKQSYTTIWENMKEGLSKDTINQASNTTGWNNKMFVKNSLMPHQIQITDIKLERLQDISNEDCIKEGIEYVGDSNSDKVNDYFYHYHNDELKPERRHQRVGMFSSPSQAFSYLIDDVSGKGTWERNEYHVVYYYKLIK